MQCVNFLLGKSKEKTPRFILWVANERSLHFTLIFPDHKINILYMPHLSEESHKLFYTMVYHLADPVSYT